MGGNAGFTLLTARDRARGRDGRVKGGGVGGGGLAGWRGDRKRQFVSKLSVLRS